MNTGCGLDFVVIGAQKGGTTQLARGIGQHPDIWMPNGEVPVFRDPVFSAAKMVALEGSLCEHSDKQMRGIKCPDYFARPEVPERLNGLGRRPKLLLCLRDPVARAVSAYFWHVRWGLLPVEDPGVGLTKVLDGAYRESSPSAADILDWGLYGRHLTTYLRYFSLNDIHILFNDELREHPSASFRSIFRFLGVDNLDFRPPYQMRSINKGVYDRRRLRFLNLRNRYILSWNADKTYTSLARPSAMAPRIFSWTVAGIDRILLSQLFRADASVVPADVTNRLREYYRSDIERLEGLLRRELPSWKA